MTDKEMIERLKDISAVCKVKECVAYKQAVDRVISMLTPKPIVGRHTQCTCPVCGRRIRSGNGSSSNVRDKRCQDCGQVIDWTEFDEREHTRWKSKGR